MDKINGHWFFYWLGCIIGGIIIGFVYAQLLGDKEIKVLAESSGELVEQPVSTVAPESTPVEIARQDNKITIIATGDVMLGRSVNQNIIKNQNYNWPFIYVSEVLKQADITFINLESPLVANCPGTDTGMKFCGDIKNIESLKGAGVDVASVANNHALNYAQEGLDETVGGLREGGIAVAGIGEPSIIEAKGTKYIFLSFNDVGRFSGIAQADTESAYAQIRAAVDLGGLVIVGFHWGKEYEANPTSRQVELARAAIDAGADLVIGTHPHWVQTSEVYKGKPIYYSLGNFVFDQEWSDNTKRGLAIRLTYEGKELVNMEELPVFISNYGQPNWQ